MSRVHPIAMALCLAAAVSAPALLHAQANTTLAHSTPAPITPASVCGTMPRRGTPPNDSLPNLSGFWDFRMEVGNRVSAGLMVLGVLDDGYGGALTPNGNTVAIRKLTLEGDVVRMNVATGEGDVLFDGYLGQSAGELCGVVTYHGGKLYPMTARRRASPAIGVTPPR